LLVGLLQPVLGVGITSKGLELVIESLESKIPGKQ